ncbi:sulfatase family protein [Zavarzinella formosa]|uniref:sulfatase family protein n=1 Tax=Zavarzinella formosa TaxID=360055 RepID=UPI0003122F4E|nr:sulfatase [Zavarzinella formosa]
MFRITLLGLLLFATFAIAAPSPNIVLIYADDMGYGDLGCYGNKTIKTPNLDRLAKEGVRFTDFYVAQAVCSASRTALLTGCYPNRLGILGALSHTSRNGISAKETTLAEVCKSKGYSTAIFGKWHLGHHPEFLPTRHGFDQYFGLPYSNDMWPKHPTAKFPPLPLFDQEKVIETNPDQTQLTTWYTEHGIKFINENKNKPFFLYMPHAMPHVPLHVSDKFKGKSAGGMYGDVIEELDWSVGEILKTLKDNKLDQNTLVMFASDNGPWLNYGNHAGTAGPLREGKGTSFDGGVRVPFIARWPNHIPADSICKTPAMTIDILPTVAKIIDAELPKLPIDGKNILPLLTEPATAKSPQDAYFIFWGKELHAVRSGPWKMHFPHEYREFKKGGKDGQPADYGTNKIGLSLFNLESDIGETKDVLADNPEVAKHLQELADKIRADLGDSLTKKTGTGAREPGMIPPLKK